MNKCPFCDVSLPSTRFACTKHWFALSPAQRSTINKGYTDYLHDRIGIERLREIQDEVINDVKGRL